MYYNYHATAQKLIADGHLTGYNIIEKYNGISPCLLLLFDNHRPMPIREYRWPEYSGLIKNANGGKEDCYGTK